MLARACVEQSSVDIAEKSSKREGGEGFSYAGYYSDERWQRTKEQNKAESECLLELWKQNANDDSEVVLQHFAGSSGFIRGYFSDEGKNEETVLFPEGDRSDARKEATFVYGSTVQKDVLILLDNSPASADWIEAMKEGARNVLSGLTDTEYVQILTTSLDNEHALDCGATGLLRATESNKKALAEWLENLSATGDGDSGYLFESAFSILASRTEDDGTGCQSVILYVSPAQPDPLLLNYITEQNTNYGARIYTYAIQTSEDPEGYLGGGTMYDISCQNEGVWFNIQTQEELPARMLEYVIVIQGSRIIRDPRWFVNFASYGDPNGMLVVGFLPTYYTDPDTQRSLLTGVVSIEFRFTGIQEFLDSLVRGVSFAYLATSQGDMLIHPSYRDPSVVVNLPLYYDSSLIESSESYLESVRTPFVRNPSGQVTIVVDRPLQKGDVGTEGFTTTPVKTSFFWSRLTSLPFVVGLAYSDAELRSANLYANTNAGFAIHGRAYRIYEDPATTQEELDLYFPEDFFTNGYGGSVSYTYTAIVDNFRSFTRKYQLETLLPSVDPATETYRDDSPLLDPATCKAFQTYLNNLVSPYNFNPGMLQQVKELSRMSTNFGRLWKADADQFCPNFFQPNASLCQTNIGPDPTSLRYVGLYTQNLMTYPGLIKHPLGVSPFFLARFRPWYQRAEANPGVAALATPYLDGAFGGKVSTVSKTIFSDPTAPADDRDILGVGGVDFPYALFHQNFVDQTGCAYDRSAADASTPMCYLIDNSGLLTLTPDFLVPTFTTIARTASDSVPLGLLEGQLAQELFDKGVLKLQYFSNFKGSYTELITDANGTVTGVNSTPIDIPQSLPVYEIDDKVFDRNAGVITGTLAKVDGYCTSGSYTVLPVAETNLYLVYIENYSKDDSDNCREFVYEQITNITFSTCDENSKHYPRNEEVCPNSDRRASVTENNRARDAQCDLIPPKEWDFVAWEDPVGIAMVVVAAVLIVFTAVCWGIIFKYRQTPVVMLASPVFIHLQFLGMILGYTNIFLWTGKPTKVQCGLRPWIASIAYVLLVGPMFAKTYRIWKLFSAKGFFAPRISDLTVLAYVGMYRWQLRYTASCEL